MERKSGVAFGSSISFNGVATLAHLTVDMATLAHAFVVATPPLSLHRTSCTHVGKFPHTQTNNRHAFRHSKKKNARRLLEFCEIVRKIAAFSHNPGLARRHFDLTSTHFAGKITLICFVYAFGFPQLPRRPPQAPEPLALTYSRAALVRSVYLLSNTCSNFLLLFTIFLLSFCIF